MSTYYNVWHTLMPNFADAWWEKATNLLNDEAKFVSQNKEYFRHFQLDPTHPSFQSNMMPTAFVSNHSKSGKTHARPQNFTIISFSQQLVKGHCFAFGKFKKERTGQDFQRFLDETSSKGIHWRVGTEAGHSCLINNIFPIPDELTGGAPQGVTLVFAPK
jgi:hypothetical protein